MKKKTSKPELTEAKAKVNVEAEVIPLTITVTREQYFEAVKLIKKNPDFYDWEKLLGQEKALQILSATFHEIPVQLAV